MKTLLKTSIFALTFLFASSAFAFSFEEVTLFEKPENISLDTQINFIAPEVELDNFTNLSDTSVTFNGYLDELNSASAIQTTFVYKELTEEPGSIEAQTEALLFVLNVYQDYEENPNDPSFDVLNAQYLSQDDEEFYTDFIFDQDEVYIVLACGEYLDDEDILRGVCEHTWLTLNTEEVFNAPDVETEWVDDITDTTAVLQGFMNDFGDVDNEVLAFFVYGLDEEQIADEIEEEDRYVDIDTDGDDVQKVLFGEINENDNDNFNLGVTNLISDSEYYVVACVQYDDENNNDKLSCGDMEDFETELTATNPCIGEDICVELVESDTVIISNDGDIVRYDILLEIEAQEDDIRMFQKPFYFDIVEEDGTILTSTMADITSVTTSSADIQNGVFVLEEGEEEEFVLSVVVSDLAPMYEGEYALQMRSVRYWRDGYYRENFFNLDTEEFRTDFEEIESTTPTPYLKNIR